MSELKFANMKEKGVLWRTRCYMIGHMENANGEGWRKEAQSRLEKLGVICFDPYHKPFMNQYPETEEIRQNMNTAMDNGALGSVHEYMKRVRNDDLRLTDIPDFLICHMDDPTIASHGTSEEIYTANRAKKPIFISLGTGIASIPKWLLGALKPSYFYNSMDDMLNMLELIDKEKVRIDSDRWKLLRHEYR